MHPAHRLAPERLATKRGEAVEIRVGVVAFRVAASTRAHRGSQAARPRRRWRLRGALGRGGLLAIRLLDPAQPGGIEPKVIEYQGTAVLSAGERRRVAGALRVVSGWAVNGRIAGGLPFGSTTDPANCANRLSDTGCPDTAAMPSSHNTRQTASYSFEKFPEASQGPVAGDTIGPAFTAQTCYHPGP